MCCTRSFILVLRRWKWTKSYPIEEKNKMKSYIITILMNKIKRRQYKTIQLEVSFKVCYWNGSPIWQPFFYSLLVGQFLGDFWANFSAWRLWHFHFTEYSTEKRSERYKIQFFFSFFSLLDICQQFFHTSLL